MSYTIQDTISCDLITIKSDMGSLLETCETLVAIANKTNERQNIIRELFRIMQQHQEKLPKLEGSQVMQGLSQLLELDTNTIHSSFATLQKTQDQVAEQAKRLSHHLEAHLSHIDQLLDGQQTSAHEGNAGLILAQEDERKRISREIHDGPAQSLANLTMRIDFCLDNIDDRGLLEQELQDFKSSIIRSLRDIRRFIFDLRPMALDDLGLLPTLEQFISGFKQRTGLPVYLTIEGERRTLPVDRALGIFRVIQEAVNNSARHAEAQAIHVFLTFDVERARLSGAVKDDGKGFDLVALRRTYATMKKLGLTSMEERIRLAGGDFDIISQPGAGTVVSFSVPLPV